MTNRVDWLRLAVWTGVVAFACIAANALLWLAQRVLMAVWPFVQAHADAVVGAVLTVCVVALVVLAVAERAKKDNPTW